MPIDHFRRHLLMIQTFDAWPNNKVGVSCGPMKPCSPRSGSNVSYVVSNMLHARAWWITFIEIMLKPGLDNPMPSLRTCRETSPYMPHHSTSLWCAAILSSGPELLCVRLPWTWTRWRSPTTTLWGIFRRLGATCSHLLLKPSATPSPTPTTRRLSSASLGGVKGVNTTRTASRIAAAGLGNGRSIHYFFQSDQRGILPILYKASSNWKDLQQKGQMALPLRSHLFQVTTQELLNRLEKRYEEQIVRTIYGRAFSRPISLRKQAIGTTWGTASRQNRWSRWTRRQSAWTKWRKDLGDPRTGEGSITDPTLQVLEEADYQSQCHVQITGRQQRLWQLLTALSHSSIWLLLYSRLRQHQSRSNPLAETLAQSLRSSSKTQPPKHAWHSSSSIVASGAMWMPQWSHSFAAWCSATQPTGQTLQMGQRLYNPSYGIHLLDSAEFAALRHAWGKHHQQEDTHEFVHILLEWSRPFCLNAEWSRRLQLPDRVPIFDHGSRSMPPTLQVGEGQKGLGSLQQLVDSWHEHNGMRTCFHEATDVLGLHIGRLRRELSGQLCKSEWISIPVCSFLSGVRQSPWTSIIENMFQWRWSITLGLQRRDTFEQQSPQGWYLTDDNRVALPDPDHLELILQDINYVWLIREDALHLKTLPSQLYGKDEWVTKAVWYIYHMKHEQLKAQDGRTPSLSSQSILCWLWSSHWIWQPCTPPSRRLLDWLATRVHEADSSFEDA